MQLRKYLLLATSMAIVALAMTSNAFASSFSSVVVYGDSLSDNGNLAELFGTHFPNPPSYQDSFTNGPVAAAVLAGRLGLSTHQEQTAQRQQRFRSTRIEFQHVPVGLLSNAIFARSSQAFGEP